MSDDEHGLDLEPVPAIVLRADEAVPAEMVKDSTGSHWRRASLVVLILVLLSFVIRDFKTASDNQRDLQTAALQRTELIAEIQHLTDLVNSANANSVAAQKEIAALRTAIDRQNRLLVAAGIAPVPVPGEASPTPSPSPTAAHSSPRPSPSSSPTQRPTPRPTHSPSPSPSPSPSHIICVPTTRICL